MSYQSNRGNRGQGRGRGNRGRGQQQQQQRPQQQQQNQQPQQQPPPFFAPPPNYADQSRIQQAALEQQKIAERLKQNEQLAEAAKNKPSPKKAEYIEEGKQILSSFFNGFSEMDRGNVRVEFNHNVGNQLACEYYDAIENYVEMESSLDEDDDTKLAKSTTLATSFNGIVNLGISIKLGRSGTDSDRKRLKGLSLLNSPTQIRLPKKLSVIINQMGKTDLPNDNHLRINDQGIVAKQMLVRGVFNYFKPSKYKNYLITGVSLDSLKKNIVENIHLMVDNNSQSVDFIQNICEQRFNEYRLNNFEATYAQGKTLMLSLPSFDFKTADEDSIVKYLQNDIFTFVYKKINLPQIVGIIVSPLLTIDVIRKPQAKLGTLFSKFSDSYLANVTVKEILDVCNIWNINHFISDNDLDDLSNLVYEHWEKTGHKEFSSFLDMSEFNFTTFGTDAQVVEISSKNIVANNDKFRKHERQRFGLALNYIKDKAKALVKFKISETGAVFGAGIKFNKSVNFSSDYEVMVTGKNRKILQEFLRKDFIR